MTPIFHHFSLAAGKYCKKEALLLVQNFKLFKNNIFISFSIGRK
jgi:hypothetical protein